MNINFAPYTRNSKISCPQCGKPRCLSRYINTDTGQYLPDHVGICDRIEKCGYKYTWWDYVRDDNIDLSTYKSHSAYIDTKPKKFNVISKDVFNRSFQKKHKDVLSQFLIKKFGANKVIPILNMYKIGYAKTWGNKDCTVFWQIDSNNKIRSGKIMAYKEIDGDIKRIKGNDKPLINWVHSFYDKEYNLKQCFFGEHLINRFLNKEIIIVEGEKTALICAINYPNYLWLSSGMLLGINDDKMKPLKGRKIILCPDKGEKAFEIWNKKCNHYKKEGFDISIRKITNELITDGDDIADIILQK